MSACVAPLGKNCRLLLSAALLIAFALGTVLGLGLMAVRGVEAGRKTKVPFGPFMAAGGVIALFFGEQMVDWYLDTFTGP